jgi:hypothetical protein
LKKKTAKAPPSIGPKVLFDWPAIDIINRGGDIKAFVHLAGAILP